MENAGWSATFAEEVAHILGYTPPEKGSEPFRAEADQLVGAIAEAFRYLPGEKVTQTFRFVDFLRAQGPAAMGPRPQEWLLKKLREVRDYVSFLRQQYGADEPADEKDYWTEEDERDLQAATWSRLDEEDPWPQDDHPTEEQRNDDPG